MTINLNLYLGLGAVIGIGVLATQGWLSESWAQMAAAFLLGGGTAIGGKEWQARRPTPPPADPEPPEINALR